MKSSKSLIPLLVVLGPTAVGKTALAIELAETYNGEIINADSRQIYRYMDIGTAKPTSEQQSRVPHHMVSIVDPDETLTVAQYQEMANQQICEIHQRGKIPILAGGTGQYITAILEGWSIPKVAPNAEIRAEYENFAQTYGVRALYEELQKVDAEAAQQIHPNNTRRVIRALEVIRVTGQRFSEQRRKTPPPYHVLQFGLTMERETLYQQADQRVHTMIEMGFVEEVKSLLMRYDRRLSSMSGLGYRELASHLLDGISLEQAITETCFQTHNFIRRQYTWFRNHDDGIQWIDRKQMDQDHIHMLVETWLQANPTSVAEE